MTSAKPMAELLQFFLNVDPIRSNFLVKLLFKVRLGLGKAFNLDDCAPSIPGTGELSIGERMANPRPLPKLAQKSTYSNFKLVYVNDKEALLEISNKTIFALVHLGKKGDEVWMGIYTKSHNALSDVYMSLIRPFRHFIVYPSWLAQLENEWKKESQL
jgi:hypothetical protein